MVAPTGYWGAEVGESYRQPRLKIVPAELRDANEFVAKLHRHHKPVTGHRWSLAVRDENEQVRGVAIIGRPTARKIDQRSIVEVIRVATDGGFNACSALYGAACRQQRSHGYEKAITFTLKTEPGTSLRAAGWKPVALTKAGGWSRPSRKRKDDHPTIQKIRWECQCSDLSAIDLRGIQQVATPSSLRDELVSLWAPDTAVDPEQWTADRPSTGHCAVTALLVQEYTDATTILRVQLPDGGSHYYNALPDGTEVDLTRDQFDTYEPVGAAEERTREYLLSNAGTRQRWDTLRNRLGEHWFGSPNKTEADVA